MTAPRPAEPSETAARLLLVDRDMSRSAAVAAEVARCLEAPPAVAAAQCGREALDALRAAPFDIVMLDLASLDDFATSPEEAVGRVVKLSQGALTVALSDGASISAAVAVMGAGAHDMLARPLAPGAVVARIVQLAQRHGKAHLLAADAGVPELLAELANATTQMQAIGSLLGAPADIQQLQALMRRLAEALGPEVVPAETAAVPARPVLPMWQQEQRIIEDAIMSFGGNVALAAAALELSPSTIYRKRQGWAELEARKGVA